jgi:integrase
MGREDWRMTRTLHRLTATRVAGRLKPGYYGDGGNLYFRVAEGGTKGWIFRFKMYGRTRDAGLGAYPAISLARARVRAFEYRALVADGVDPIDQRNAQQAAARVENAKTITFDDCAKAYITAHADGWRSAKHLQQWRNTLDAYAAPVLGRLPIRAIDTGLIMRVLEPMWASKPETASRLRGRIESVLSWATVRGYRIGENPARWRGHLDSLLPAKSKVRKVEHHAALPYVDVGRFMHDLRQQAGLGARALEFLILTATRAGEVLNATWDEFDLETSTWSIPAGRMKGGREHRVPLSDAAMAVLKAAQELRQSDYVFPGAKAARPLSLMSLKTTLERTGQNVTSHGFRSTFRDWAAEQTSYANHVVEMALAHAVPNAVEAAYRRGDLFDKRRRLMDDWAQFCATPVATSGRVVPIRRRRK